MKIRSEFIEGVVLQLHGRAPILAVYVVTAAALHDGHDGLSCLRKICKADLCVNWTCMINADLVAIGHVSGSPQLGRFLHEVVTFTIIVDSMPTRRCHVLCLHGTSCSK